MVRRKTRALYVVAGDHGTGGAGDISKVTPASRVIAVVMPNDQTVGHGWTKYRTSVAAVEKLAGYTFFDRVPNAVIGPLRTKVDDEHVAPTKPPAVED